MLQASTLQFLKGLKKNNAKEWFDGHRKEYDAAKGDFAALVKEIIEQHGKKDATIAELEAKQCVFRINRDVRFSKDKAPYKSNFGASFKRDGKKSVYAGYYIHVEPGGNSFIGGGLWMPEPDALKKVRQEIDYCLEEFEGIVKSKKFIKVYNGLENADDLKLSRPPKGYELDNPAIEYLKFKSFIASCPVNDEDLLSKGFPKKVLEAFETIQPLLDFINRSVE
ncbi:TIGR02453 family protein [Filimonas lacunae]|uniref:TIGR02453 family protein n=1 Tax=Filimonas lacunae TaxID=477680 RepID=A0A173MPI3_9BACT|nr:DUF2461 domain-containing protein [Filimonas lacunae]BAV09301.1 hypothetical protein FLA_5349 [Filimonas lacunae]SIS70757.1 TIGR02453 family protein [Filimonas lacunae]